MHLLTLSILKLLKNCQHSVSTCSSPFVSHPSPAHSHHLPLSGQHLPSFSDKFSILTLIEIICDNVDRSFHLSISSWFSLVGICSFNCYHIAKVSLRSFLCITPNPSWCPLNTLTPTCSTLIYLKTHFILACSLTWVFILPSMYLHV